MKRYRFTVSLPAVEGVPCAEFKEYIREAVSSWAGQYPPRNPTTWGGEQSHPLGPPCVLMDEGAVVVTQQRRRR